MIDSFGNITLCNTITIILIINDMTHARYILPVGMLIVTRFSVTPLPQCRTLVYNRVISDTCGRHTMSDIQIKVTKVSDTQPIVYGWGSICKVRDESGNLVDYWDTDNERYPEDVTEQGWRDFMLNSRHMDVMHDEKVMGKVVYAMAMLEDVAKAYGILDCLDRTGVMVGVQVDDPDTLAKFRSGEYSGFSIGGYATYENG